MIHGFGGAGLVFYKMIPYLKNHFRVTTIDLLGQGFSGRPNFTLTNCQDCIDYFLLSLRAWMKTSKYDSEPFIMSGHSMGGYLSTLYAI
jgi:pimeloyl-ACP methyl ester carboxylesterase